MTPTYRPDEHMPFLTLNESGNGVVLDHNKSWATRVYRGNIGDTNVPYSWFNSFWGTALGTKTYQPVFDSRDERIITLQTKGYYKFLTVINLYNSKTVELIYTINNN